MTRCLSLVKHRTFWWTCGKCVGADCNNLTTCNSEYGTNQLMPAPVLVLHFQWYTKYQCTHVLLIQTIHKHSVCSVHMFSLVCEGGNLKKKKAVRRWQSICLKYANTVSARVCIPSRMQRSTLYSWAKNLCAAEPMCTWHAIVWGANHFPCLCLLHSPCVFWGSDPLLVLSCYSSIM